MKYSFTFCQHYLKYSSHPSSNNFHEMNGYIKHLKCIWKDNDIRSEIDS